MFRGFEARVREPGKVYSGKLSLSRPTDDNELWEKGMRKDIDKDRGVT